MDQNQCVESSYSEWLYCRIKHIPSPVQLQFIHTECYGSAQWIAGKASRNMRWWLLENPRSSLWVRRIESEQIVWVRWDSWRDEPKDVGRTQITKVYRWLRRTWRAARECDREDYSGGEWHCRRRMSSPFPRTCVVTEHWGKSPAYLGEVFHCP